MFDGMWDVDLQNVSQEEVELFEHVAQYQDNLHHQKFFVMVKDIRGYTENECNEPANEKEERISKGEGIMDMLKTTH